MLVNRKPFWGDWKHGGLGGRLRTTKPIPFWHYANFLLIMIHTSS